jgi:uncharacterized protein
VDLETLQPTAPRQPYVTIDNAYMWEGVAAGELRVQRCKSCGRLRHPSRPMCAQCQSLEWEPFACSGQGAIYSYVVFHHPQLEGYLVPYIVAVIELTEGVRMVSNVVGISPANVRIGMQVRVAFEDVGGRVVLPVFRPI